MTFCTDAPHPHLSELAVGEQMVEYMKKVAESSQEDLSLEERNLLSVAYKNVVGARRASLRIIGSIESKEVEKGSDKAQLVKLYKTKVSDELDTICRDILNLLDTTLIKKAAKSDEASVFYLKMKVREPLCRPQPSLNPLASRLAQPPPSPPPPPLNDPDSPRK